MGSFNGVIFMNLWEFTWNECDSGKKNNKNDTDLFRK